MESDENGRYAEQEEAMRPRLKASAWDQLSWNIQVHLHAFSFYPAGTLRYQRAPEDQKKIIVYP